MTTFNRKRVSFYRSKPTTFVEAHGILAPNGAFALEVLLHTHTSHEKRHGQVESQELVENFEALQRKLSQRYAADELPDLPLDSILEHYSQSVGFFNQFVFLASENLDILSQKGTTNIEDRGIIEEKLLKKEVELICAILIKILKSSQLFRQAEIDEMFAKNGPVPSTLSKY
ncbi:MAG: hypothetical protein ACI9BD_001601, partial [Candidatus Marinamargulisbacteria bacterium]